MKKIHKLDDLTFDNRFVEQLPADTEVGNACRQVIGACYSHVKPTPVQDPKTIIVAREVADLLDLSKDVCISEEFTHIFAGNRLAKGMQPYAMCYGGHQFGQWAGQLGDGRAINLGEAVNTKNEHWALQLKGAGKTPYSRQSDGLAVLRSSVREFICSEAMYHLGVPTTRALSLVLTGEKVWRDMFYDGNGAYESGAIVCRVAPSFTRFGNFQILSSRGDAPLLKQLVDFTIRTDFPELGDPSEEVYLNWFSQVCLLTAQMVVHWQRVGFVHGVMNTDNMSILGLTIDYGPYGWLEDFDLKWTLGGEPFLTTPGTLVDAVVKSIAQETGLSTELSTTGGTSDGRFIAKICPQIIEFGPPNGSIHKINEHIALSDIEPLKNIYKRVLIELNQQVVL